LSARGSIKSGSSRPVDGALPLKLLFGLCLLLASLELRQDAFGFEKCGFSLRIEVFDSCLTPVLGTGGAGASDLVLCEVARDDDTSLVDCLEHVSCVKVLALVIIIVYTYIYLLLLGATLGEVS
jgi:hypothetical protein